MKKTETFIVLRNKKNRRLYPKLQKQRRRIYIFSAID